MSSRREDWEHYQARLRLLPPARRANVEEYCRAAYDEPMRQILDRCIRPGDRVLDIGCGEGRWVAYLLNRGVNCVGLDFLPSAVREARRRCFPIVRRTVVLQGDATQLPFRPGSFDAILSFGLLEHFPRHEAVLRHWYDLLREGGVAIISVPNARRWDWVLYSVLRQWLVTHQLPHLRQTTRGMASTMYGHEECWTPAYLRSLCRGGSIPPRRDRRPFHAFALFFPSGREPPAELDLLARGVLQAFQAMGALSRGGRDEVTLVEVLGLG